MAEVATSGATPAPLVKASRRDAGEAVRRFLPALPAAVVFLLLFVGPMAFMLVFSLWRTNQDFDLVPDWNVDNYIKFLTVPTYLKTFGKTALMAAAVTIVGIATALPFTYYLVRYVSRRWQRLILLAVIVPFWTSYLLRVYAWQAILGERGAVNQLLMGLGIIHEPSRLFVYNDVGVFIVLVYVYFPFAVLAIYASLERFDFSQLLAAQDLGARPDQAFRKILLPQIRPGIITACIFVFIPIFGEFLAPILVGGTQGVLIANLIINFFRGAQIDTGAALSLVIALFVTLLLVVFRRHLRLESVVSRG